MIDFGKLQSSLMRLQEQHENYRLEDSSLSELTRDAIAESVIQRFETCYDCLWKVLKRYLREELGIAEVPNSPKPVFRLANENHLLSASIERWLEYAQARIDTSHDYDGTKAQDCLALIPEFIDNAIGLFQCLTDQQWH